MGWRGSFVSLGLHAAAIAVISTAATSKKEVRGKTTVAIVPQKKKETPPPPPPPKKERPPPPKAEPKVERSDAAPPPKAPPVDLGAIDFGTDDGGSATPSGVGVAVPSPRARGAPPPLPKNVKRVEAKTTQAASRLDAACDEEPTKPKPIEKVKIEYPVEARESGLEGRLVLKLFIDEAGRVEKVEVVRGIGDVLDRACIAAVMRWRFEPAMACGKPVPGSYKLARLFELGD